MKGAWTQSAHVDSLEEARTRMQESRERRAESRAKSRAFREQRRQSYVSFLCVHVLERY